MRAGSPPLDVALRMEAATPCKLHITRRRMGIVQSALWAAPEEAGNVWKLGLNRQWAQRWMLLCGPNLYYWANEKVGGLLALTCMLRICLVAAVPRRADCGKEVRRPSQERSPQV